MVNEENLILPFQINNFVKGSILRLNSVANDIIDKSFPRYIKSNFAESIAIAASLGHRMKNDGIFSLQLKSEGIIKTILVDIYNNSSLRGYISFDQYNEKNLTFEDYFLNGYLALTINEGKFSDNYQSTVKIEGKTLEESIQSYFDTSQQIKTYFKTFNVYNLFSQNNFAKSYITGAIKLELMPQTETSIFSESNEKDWEEIKLFLSTIKSEEFLNKDNSLKQILIRLFGQYDVKVFEEIILNSKCRCSKRRVLYTLKSMKSDELDYLFKKNEGLEVVCEFCKKKRVIFKSEI